MRGPRLRGAGAAARLTRHAPPRRWVWESAADGAFSIAEDTQGEPLGRGTQINIFLKEEAQEYADEAKLKELVQRYSEFINFPIYLHTEKSVTKQVPVEEEEEEASAEDVAADGDAEDDDEEEEAPATRSVTETVRDWELLNDNKAIWLRKPADVTKEEYEKFYTAISKVRAAAQRPGSLAAA